MAASGKRLDLRFGVFACSVQGFDDPVQPVQQILRAIQHLLEETPELADAGINFDPETIERLVGEVAQRAEIDENEIEIVPGLVMIHHAGGGDLARRGDAAASAHAWDDAGADAPQDYVNIFAASGGGEATGAAREDLAERMDRMAADERAGSAADYGWDETDDDAREHATEHAGAESHIFAMSDERDDPPGYGDAEAEHAPSNLFASAGDEAGSGEVRNLFAAPGEEEADEAYARVRPGNGADWDEPLELTGGAAAGAETPAEDEAAGDADDEGYTAAGLAERAKARSVPDLMVCAAAWMVLIQGSTQFKRRDVLDVFETIPGDHEKSLEAQIKGFGKAVRNGRLVMVEDGIFGLSRAELERFQRLL